MEDKWTVIVRSDSYDGGYTVMGQGPGAPEWADEVCYLAGQTIEEDAEGWWVYASNYEELQDILDDLLSYGIEVGEMSIDSADS